jgi:hypothetical protein
MSFEGAGRAVIILIVDRKVTESLLEEGYCCFVYSNPVVPCFDLPALSDFGYLAELWLETSFTRVFEASERPEQRG